MPTNRRTERPPAPRAEVLDLVNRQILGLLQEDPRLSMAALARQVGMSTSAVTERVDRLRSDGVVVGWRLEVDPAAIGLPVTAYARMRPGPGQLAKVTALVPDVAEVTECHRITGDDCFLLKLQVASMAHLAEVLDRLSVHGQLTTSIVVSTPVPLRSVALPPG
ncbi:Lrp/AsnC family transcriptional regulator, leucine-responsive regulatory protein [Microlunatus sagamiharensis]|uniref:Lrp/AsnC family transcriptional regulator, leucine-responsive regulatory protein n=1 Tax=Microlunatus sagamiharensis TaxID=546874 RepID=A0A1H2N9N2_9ACTN|nr:Lrp/AsnC family transcriptional regulator, leucine-responsive regulatory protein [Microlunatus sagamiharensis]